MLADSFGRIATDLRVSLTDRCNLRCAYCMPPEGLDWLPQADQLTDDEVVRLVRIGVELLGIREVRFTGGEPLLRRGLAGIIARTAELRPRPEISLTTNAIGLARTAGVLRAAGLDRINVSLDTLRHETFRKLARRDRLPDVLDGLAAAAQAGLHPVKVNAVLMRDLNDDEAVPLLRYCLEAGYELRFIEQMPLDAQHGWKRAEMVTAEEILAALGREFTLTPGRGVPGRRRPGPGRRHRVGHPAVLRDLRPGAADRRRPDTELPVRPIRKRPARPASGRGGGRRAGRGVAARRRGEAARPRHQRPVVPAAGPPDVRDRRLRPDTGQGRATGSIGMN
jgi:cyclic pyranopterin phosphate synthase